MSRATLAAIRLRTQLWVNYTPGSGTMVLLPGSDGIWANASPEAPGFLMIERPGDIERTDVRAIYTCTGSSGGSLTGVAISEGIDQPYPAGSVVSLCADTSSAVSGSGITDLDTLPAYSPSDVLMVVDVSDTTMSPEGTNKQVTAGVLLAGAAAGTLTGDVLSTTGATTFFGQTHAITPTITASQDNWAPTGLATANVIMTTNATGMLAITGLLAGTDGQIVTLRNAAASTFPLVLRANSASSSAANRLGFSSDVFLAPGESCLLMYRTASATWVEMQGHRDYQSGYYGGGQDGVVAISSGTTTLTRDMYYSTLTISGTGSLVTSGYRVYVSELLDLSAAPAGAIKANGNAGGNGSGNTAGIASAAITAVTAGVGSPGRAAGAGTTTVGAAGTISSAVNQSNGGNGRPGGAGGLGPSGAGGAAGGAATATALPVYKFADTNFSVTTFINGGYGGAGGGGGGGDGTNTGGGGGGGGGGGCVLYLVARFVSRGTNATAAIIQAQGGAAGNGANGVAGNSGGGGGGGGGSGGWIYFCYGYLLGTAIANGLDASSSAGGTGGNLAGTGVNGVGGSGGAGGRITKINLTTGLVSETSFTTTSVAASGTTGGAATAVNAGL